MRSVRLSADELDRLVRRLRAAGCVFAEEEAELLAEAAASPRSWSADRARAWPASRWSRCSAGRSSAGSGSRWRRGCSCRGAHRAARGRAGAGAGAGPDRWWSTSAAASGRSARPCWRAGSAGVELYAADVDPAAVACARRNLPAAAGLRGRPVRRRCRPGCAAGRRGGGQRAVRPDRRDRADAARGPRPRAPRRARRRRRRARRAAPGSPGLRRGCGRAATCWWRPAGASSTAPARRSARRGSRSWCRRRRVRRAGRTRDDVPQRRYGRPVRPALEFSVFRGVPRSGDGSHPHVRRSPGGGWLRSGAVAFLRGSVGYASASASSRSRGTGTASSDRASTRRRP